MTSPSYLLVIVIMYIISIKKLTFITMAPVYKNGGGGSSLHKSFPLTYNPFFFSKFISIDSRNPYSFCLIYSWILLLFNFLWGNFPTSWKFLSSLRVFAPFPGCSGVPEKGTPHSSEKVRLAYELCFHIGSFCSWSSGITFHPYCNYCCVV